MTRGTAAEADEMPVAGRRQFARTLGVWVGACVVGVNGRSMVGNTRGSGVKHRVWGFGEFDGK